MTEFVETSLYLVLMWVGILLAAFGAYLPISLWLKNDQTPPFFPALLRLVVSAFAIVFGIGVTAIAFVRLFEAP